MINAGAHSANGTMAKVSAVSIFQNRRAIINAEQIVGTLTGFSLAAIRSGWGNKAENH